MNHSPFSLTGREPSAPFCDDDYLIYSMPVHFLVGTRCKTHVTTRETRSSRKLSSILLSRVSRLLAGPKAVMIEAQGPLSIWNRSRVYAWSCLDVRIELVACVRPYKDVSRSAARGCCLKSGTFTGALSSHPHLEHGPGFLTLLKSKERPGSASASCPLTSL